MIMKGNIANTAFFTDTNRMAFSVFDILQTHKSAFPWHYMIRDNTHMMSLIGICFFRLTKVKFPKVK